MCPTTRPREQNVPSSVHRTTDLRPILSPEDPRSGPSRDPDSHVRVGVRRPVESGRVDPTGEEVRSQKSRRITLVVSREVPTPPLPAPVGDAVTGPRSHWCLGSSHESCDRRTRPVSPFRRRPTSPRQTSPSGPALRWTPHIPTSPGLRRGGGSQGSGVDCCVPAATDDDRRKEAQVSTVRKEVQVSAVRKETWAGRGRRPGTPGSRGNRLGEIRREGSTRPAARRLLGVVLL